MDLNDDHLTAQQAKKYACRKTLYNYVQQGKLTLLKYYRGRNVYIESEIREVFGTLGII
jgi:predicted site-specific integrase-resolvase